MIRVFTGVFIASLASAAIGFTAAHGELSMAYRGLRHGVSQTCRLGRYSSEPFLRNRCAVPAHTSGKDFREFRTLSAFFSSYTKTALARNDAC